MTAVVTLDISPDVLYGIAQLALDKVEAVTPIAPPARVGEILSGKRAKGIRIDRDGDQVRVLLTVSVDYGARIPEVVADAQNAIREAMGSMTGLEVAEVSVVVESIVLGEDIRRG